MTREFTYAIVGCGAMIAQNHFAALKRLDNARIVGACDTSPGRGAARAVAVGAPLFVDHIGMIERTRPDVVVICTPHPSHARIAVDSLARGSHVLTEKPMAIAVSEADAMIEAADRAGRVLAVNFQQRFRPVVERAKALIDAGEIGDLVRVLCVEPWCRPAAYYRDAPWRGTWAGEGGAVLLNQAPHDLDLLCHLAGMPTRVTGWARTLRHDIACEDTAQAMLEFANGAPGYFYSSTAEAGSAQRLHIVGERGAVDVAGESLTITRLSPPLREHIRTNPNHYASPDITTESESLAGDGGGHLAVHLDLQRVIEEGGRPRADGLEGRMSLELANAIRMSSELERPVSLPVDRASYSAFLNAKRGV